MTPTEGQTTTEAPITNGAVFVDRQGQEWCVQEVLGFGRYNCRKMGSPHHYFGLEEWTGRQIRALIADRNSTGAKTP